MNTRRDFLKLGALFVPAAILAPRVAYSFLRPAPALRSCHWLVRAVKNNVVIYEGNDSRAVFTVPGEGTYYVSFTYNEL